VSKKFMRSKKTIFNYPRAAAIAAEKAAVAAGKMRYRRGPRPKEFDWSTVTPKARAAAIAEYYKKVKP